MSEVVLSVGSFSRRVATHLYSLQDYEDEDYDSANMFMTSYSKAFPRLLAIDYRAEFPSFALKTTSNYGAGMVDWGAKAEVVRMDTSHSSSALPEPTLWSEALEVRCISSCYT